MEVEADDGTIRIPPRLLERFGERFELIDRRDRILLVPEPEDPLAALREEWQDVEGSVEELRREAMEAAMAEADENR